MRPYDRDTWAEVDLDAIRANVQALRNHLPAKTGIMAVVKADGYGHGSVQVGREALAAGAESLAVAMLDEALVLRKAGIHAPILVLGYTPAESAVKALQADIALTACHADWLRTVAALLERANAQRPLAVHVKVDTGMGRLGVRTESELDEVVDEIAASSQLTWDGIYTHFACADEEDTGHVRAQHERFMKLLSHLRQRGLELPRIHCCNSAAAMAFPEWGYDFVRFGIGLYGLYPSSHIKRLGTVQLTPALSLKTRITHVKTATEPLTVSYGATYTAAVGEQIATLPIGYADGLSRALSNRGEVLHGGRRVPIVGRVCMDQTMIRIDGTGARVGDEVVIYGRQGDEAITLDEAAERLGTINYEVACMLSVRVPRVYVRGGQITDICHGLYK